MLGAIGQYSLRSPRWITLIRLMVYIFLPVISLGFLWKFQPPARLLPLVGLIVLALLINVGQLISWKRTKNPVFLSPPGKQARVPLFRESVFNWSLDLVMITGIVHYTGGPVSDFWFLYALVIIAAGFARGVRGSFAAAGAASIAYGTIITLSYQGVLAQVLPDPTMQRPDWGPTMGLKVFLVISFFLLMAALAGYVTEHVRRKSGELAVKTSELDQLKLDTDTIMETIPAGILVYDLSGNILYFNRVGLRLLDVPENIFANGAKIQTFLKYQSPFFDILQRLIDHDLPLRLLEVNVPTSKSRIRTIGIRAKSLMDKDGGNRGVVVYFNDLSEEKALERELRISDRLSAVGELASDLAHEIRNPLAVIRGSVEFMARELNPGGQMERLMTGVLKESDRLNNLVYEFMEFSRLSPPECSTLPVKTVLRTVQKIPKISEYLDQIYSTSSKAMCWADRDQLLRALDSMIRDVGRQWDPPGKAELLIAESGKLFEVWENETIQIPKEQVGFVIRYPGKVLNDADVDDLFRPFRHADEKHRGLALCTAHRIVESHRGEIRVLNVAGRGLALVVLIPLAGSNDMKEAFPLKGTVVPLASEGARA